MVSGSQSWRELGIGAKVFISLVVVWGTCVLLYGAINPTSKNIAQFICYLLIAILAARLKVRLPGITGTMSVNFLFILLGILELGFAETLVLGTAATLVQCFYRDRPSPVRGVPHHGEPLRLQQRPRRLTETVVVIDDQHGRAHPPIVAEIPLGRIVASTNPPRSGLRAGTNLRLWPAPIRPRPAARSVGRRKHPPSDRRATAVGSHRPRRRPLRRPGCVQWAPACRVRRPVRRASIPISS